FVQMLQVTASRLIGSVPLLFGCLADIDKPRVCQLGNQLFGILSMPLNRNGVEPRRERHPCLFWKSIRRRDPSDFNKLSQQRLRAKRQDRFMMHVRGCIALRQSYSVALFTVMNTSVRRRIARKWRQRLHEL